MARKGIAPWADGEGELGYDGMAWKNVRSKEAKIDLVVADELRGKSISGDLAGRLVADVSKHDDGLVVTRPDGTAETIPLATGTTLGWCRKRRIERDSASVVLYWEDPGNGYEIWQKTIIVKKEGSYPESPTDGQTVVVSKIKNQYLKNGYIDTQVGNDNWFYRAFPVSTNGNTGYHQLNRFGFWHYAIWIDREDGIESTCVHNMDGYDNQGYRPIKMQFTADVEQNTLDWGDWEDAQFMPKPCMLRSNGEVDYYLNPTDYNLKADGTANDNLSNVNYDGNAMMEWSPVYTKEETIGTKHFIYYCSEKLDDSYECFSALKEDGSYGDHWYMPIYEGRVVNNVMRSLSTGTNGTGAGAAIPTAGTTMDQEMTYAKANGTGWNTTNWADEDLIVKLGFLVMGRLNSAIAIGYNCGSSTSALTHNIGTSNQKGMFFGHYTTSKYATKFFGMENWWGHRWRRVIGIIIKDYAVHVKMTKSTADGSTVNNYNSTADGYINTGIKVPPGLSGTYFVDVAASKYGFAIPQATMKYKGDTGTASGSASTYYCDGAWTAAGTMALLSGGGVHHGAVDGLCAFDAYDAPSFSSWNVGGSLSYKRF